ncbi:MAG TPA: arsenate reductase [Brevundimonas sp.]|uniref:arsenate reductase n=1 Tax=Brevundimonas sp. TaxID=1871086 RepID=UPI002DED584A|nr:arsenate reductase [Brevundimonas sp.]
MILYGIPNCDTVKKARVWLDGRGTAYAFHDYKKQGVDEPALRGWVAEHGWEAVLNRKGTTFRAVPDTEKAGLDGEKAIKLMLAQPSMIKRPVLALDDGRTLVGFQPAGWDAALG